MVKFNKDSFTITVYVGTAPHECWENTVRDIIDTLQNEDEGMIKKRYYLLSLLEAMIPEAESFNKNLPN